MFVGSSSEHAIILAVENVSHPAAAIDHSIYVVVAD
jgi:hypothetical protein